MAQEMVAVNPSYVTRLAEYHKALEFDEALGDKAGMARIYGNLGIVYRTRGHLDQAAAVGCKALPLYDTLGDKEGMAKSYVGLGFVYSTQLDFCPFFGGERRPFMVQ